MVPAVSLAETFTWSTCPYTIVTSVLLKSVVYMGNLVRMYLVKGRSGSFEKIKLYSLVRKNIYTPFNFKGVLTQNERCQTQLKEIIL